MSERTLYDRIGGRYTATRRRDPRLAAAIWDGLGDAESVLDVGGGAGAYEPPERAVIALEPSEVMIAQRPAGAARVIRASAEEIPLADDSVDAAMAVLSDHHWRDRRRGFAEMRRVARRRVVLFNTSPSEVERFWLTQEYLPGFRGLIPERYRASGAWEQELHELLGSVELRPVAIPHDCVDGFYGAFWRRPAAYLDPAVQSGISVFARLPAPHVSDGMLRLEADLANGAWEQRHGDLLARDALHLGYYVVIAEVA